MKSFSWVLALLLFTPLCFAADLYIGQSGNDANSGLTAAAMKYNISAANSWSFSAGDTLYINCSSHYSRVKDGLFDPDAGTAAANTRVMTYMTSTCTPNPYTGETNAVFSTMNISNSTSDWYSLGSNIWVYRLNYTSTDGDIAQVYINISRINWSNRNSVKANFLIKESALVNVSYAGSFYSNWTNAAGTAPSSTASRLLYVYSVNNPATANPGGIGIVYNQEALELASTDNYITWQNLSIMFWGKEGFYLDGSDNNTIRYNNIGYGGGGSCGGGCSGNTPWGNGITAWYAVINFYVYNNLFKEIIDAGFSPQIIGDFGDVVNARYHVYQNNTVVHTGYCFEVSYDNETTSVNNIDISQNTCYQNDAGLFAPQRVNESQQTAIERCWRYGDTYNIRGLNIYNNICDGSPGYMLGTNSNSKGLEVAVNLTAHNNHYNKPNNGRSSTWFNIVGGSSAGTYSTLALWQAASIQEDNSTYGSISYYNEALYDFRPLTGQSVCSGGYGNTYIGAFGCVDLPLSSNNQMVVIGLYR